MKIGLVTLTFGATKGSRYSIRREVSPSNVISSGGEGCLYSRGFPSRLIPPTRPGKASRSSASASSTSKSTGSASSGSSLPLAFPLSEYSVAYGSDMASSVQRRLRRFGSVPNRGDANAPGCVLDDVLDLDAFDLRRANKRHALGAGHRLSLRF